MFGKTPMQQILEGSISYRKRDEFAKNKAVKFHEWVMKNNHSGNLDQLYDRFIAETELPFSGLTDKKNMQMQMGNRTLNPKST